MKRASIYTLTTALLIACAPAAKDDDQETPPPESAPEVAPTEQDSCEPQFAADCSTIRARIERLEAKRAAALSREDWSSNDRLSLAANQERELLALYVKREATPAALKALKSKYHALSARLEEHLKSTPTTPGETPTKPEPGTPPQDSALVYHPSEIKALAQVREEFGDLYIGPTPAASDGTPGFEELAVAMPWAGYWYPMSDDALYADADSPLVKLDTAVNALGGTGTSAETERTEHATAMPDSWEGLCGAWALASISSREPTDPVTVGGVSFTVNDQKALLTKIHERAPSTFFGIRYNGDAATDGTLQDLRPEAFHRIFTKMLGERHEAFVVDSDPSTEVWSKPVYRVRWKVTKDPKVVGAYLVEAYPWMVRHRETLEEVATSTADRASPKYEYRLYVDPASRQGKTYKVIAGEWLGASLDSHPDALMIKKSGPEGQEASRNAGINSAMEVVRQIVLLP